MKGGGAGFVGGIVQHIDSSVKERKKEMTDDGANAKDSRSRETYLTSCSWTRKQLLEIG